MLSRDDHHQIQADLDLLAKWSVEWQLGFNVCNYNPKLGVTIDGELHSPRGGGGGGTRPQNGYIGSLPGSNPCSNLYNGVKYRGSKRYIPGKYRGQNATFCENIGVKLYIQIKYIGQNSACMHACMHACMLHSENIGVKTLH